MSVAHSNAELAELRDEAAAEADASEWAACVVTLIDELTETRRLSTCTECGHRWGDHYVGCSVGIAMDAKIRSKDGT